jgi:hypothetical protein
VGVIVLLGIGILSATSRTKLRDPSGSTTVTQVDSKPTIRPRPRRQTDECAWSERPNSGFERPRHGLMDRQNDEPIATNGCFDQFFCDFGRFRK